MVVWVIGAGGIGRAVAVFLAESRAGEVRLVPLRATQVMALSNGLTLHTTRGVVRARPRVTALGDVADLDEHPDLVLLCVKGHDTERVLSVIDSRLSAMSVVVTLQNGLHAYRIAERLGESRSLGAILAFDGCASGDDEVIQRRADRRIVVGGFSGVTAGSVDLAAEVLGACAPVARTSDLAAALWGKLIANAAVNPVSAIVRQTVGATLRTPSWSRLCVGLVAEGVRVAHASGVGLTAGVLLGIEPERFIRLGPGEDRLLDDFVSAHRAVAHLRSTMCRDLDNGRATEVAWINGEIVRRGYAVGVRTPLHRYAVEAIRRLETAQGIGSDPGPVPVPQLASGHHNKTEGFSC